MPLNPGFQRKSGHHAPFIVALSLSEGPLSKFSLEGSSLRSERQVLFSKGFSTPRSKKKPVIPLRGTTGLINTSRY
jgi:hypothetical protein